MTVMVITVIIDIVMIILTCDDRNSGYWKKCNI